MAYLLYMLYAVMSKNQNFYPCPMDGYICWYIYIYIYICDRISENGSKSHMKSSVFQHIFNYICTNAHVFPEYLLHNFNNLSIKFHVML